MMRTLLCRCVFVWGMAEAAAPFDVIAPMPRPSYAEAYHRACREGRPLRVAVEVAPRLRQQAWLEAARSGELFCQASRADGFPTGLHRLVPHEGRLVFAAPNHSDRASQGTPRRASTIDCPT